MQYYTNFFWKMWSDTILHALFFLSLDEWCPMPNNFHFIANSNITAIWDFDLTLTFIATMNSSNVQLHRRTAAELYRKHTEQKAPYHWHQMLHFSVLLYKSHRIHISWKRKIFLTETLSFRIPSKQLTKIQFWSPPPRAWPSFLRY